MLMNNYENYCIPKFVLLINKNHIDFCFLFFHMSHCMQPFDVGIFQFYKHWHDVTIQNAFAKFNTEYSLNRFFQNFTKIWNNIFKKSNIRFVFIKSGMRFVDEIICIDQIKKLAGPKNLEHFVQSENSNSIFYLYNLEFNFKFFIIFN